MNSLVRIRFGLALGGGSLMFLAAAAACSSSSSNPGTDSGTQTSSGGGSSSGGSSGSSDSGPSIFEGGSATVDGTGMMCPAQTSVWVGTLVTLQVSWAAVLAASGGMGQLYIWLLSNYNISGSQITGTTRTCGIQTPALVLNATGIMAENLDASTASILDEVPTKLVWDKDTRTAPITGTLGGWNVGSSILINPSGSFAGIAPSSSFASTSAKWPMSATSFMPSDIVDDDNDGNPGITVFPLNDPSMGYYLPVTGLSNSPPSDQLYIVSRTELALYGTSSSCTEMTGQVVAPEYNLHVVGCHATGSMPGVCTSDEWQFIDENVTIYSGEAGKNTTIYGSFDSKVMGDDAAPSCDDVVSMFASPMPQPQGDW